MAPTSRPFFSLFLEVQMKIDKDELKGYVEGAIRIAEDYYKNEVEPRLLEAYKRYKADQGFYEEKLGRLGKLSKIVSSDVADKVEWVLPSLTRIFLGSDRIISIEGRTEEDDRPAEILQKLITYQIERENRGFQVLYNWFKDALKYPYGVLKATWERSSDEDTVEVYVPGFRLEEMAGAISIEDVGEYLSDEEKEKLGDAYEFSILEQEYDEEADAYRIKIKLKRLVRNAPKLENLLPFELIFVPDARNISECSFVAHKKRVKLDYLVRKEREGIFKGVKDIAEAITNSTLSQSELEQLIYGEMPDKLANYQEGLKNIYLYECYTKYDIDGDGLLEDVIVWYAGGVILRVEPNVYGRPPFFILSPILESEEIFGRSFNDMIGSLQDIKTALLKLLMVNMTKVSNPRAFYDASVIPHEVLKEAGIRQYIPLDLQGKDIRQIIQFEPVQPIAQYLLPLLEYIETQIENRTGVTRYNQGLDARSLNKTATGINLIMSAANQRIELIARIFAETGVRDLFRFLVELNQRFIDQPTVIRLTGESLAIRPDDLKGRFDFIVNAGVGVGTKEQEMQFAQLLVMIVKEALQAGIATPKELYNAYKRVVQLMGFKNVGDFLKDPEEVVNALGGNQEARAFSGALQGIPAGAFFPPEGGALQQVDGSAPGGMGGYTEGAGNPPEAGEQAP